MSTISVIVPVYNVVDVLPDCVKSILNQTYQDFELILIDDGSNDGSSSLCDEYAKNNRHVRTIHQSNHGVSFARNVGLSCAIGDYIVFVDSDDFIAPKMLESLMDKMLKTGADIVECAYYEYYAEDNCKLVQHQYDLISGTQRIINQNLTGEISVLVWNKLYRKALITHKFEEGVKYEDVLFTAHALCSCNVIANVKEPMYFWRQRRGSISHSGFDKSRWAAVDHFAERAELYRKENGNTGLIKASVIREAVLEMEAAKGNKQLVVDEYERVRKLMTQWRVSLTELLMLPTLREKARFVYYFYKYIRCKQEYKELWREKQ